MNATPDMLAAGLKMIASLAVVLAMILGLLYGIRKLGGQRPGPAGGKSIQVLENYCLGVKKSISLVRVPGKVLVLGITGDRITLLESLDEATVGQKIPAHPPTPFGPLLAERLKKMGLGLWRKDSR